MKKAGKLQPPALQSSVSEQLRTGQGSTGATYRYYTCSTKARQGKTGCKGRTIPMDKLNHLVADHIGDRLL
ncbi:MAG: zinc ribbon domain-containing protein [Nitratireductor sp.]|uniref:zinc ribbon domain-containing protein n=1 Tax=Parasphingorhabdus sp. TaxID=2709688 RepID=UPI00326728C6